jgi:hypothetical protein
MFDALGLYAGRNLYLPHLLGLGAKVFGDLNRKTAPI